MRQRIVMIIGFVVGMSFGLLVQSGTPQEVEAKVAPPLASENEGLIDFIRSEIDAGRIQSAKYACEYLKSNSGVNSSEFKTAAAKLKEINSIKARHAKKVEDQIFLPFAKELDGSGRAVNNCKFNRIYSRTKTESRVCFARYFKERKFTHTLTVNIKYPLYHWGDNRHNLQYGLVTGLTDAILDSLRTAGSTEKFGELIESNTTLRYNFMRGLDIARAILGIPHLRADEKGEIYYRLTQVREALIINTDKKFGGLTKMHVKLNRAIDRYKPFAKEFDPAIVNTPEDVF